MADDLQTLLFEVADLKRRMGHMMRVGTVHEVKSSGKEQKVRVVIGKDGQGKDMLSPWLFTGNARGNAREEHRYKKGQNVMLLAPDGDLRQASVTQYAENDAFPRPAHAADDAETYQYEKLRVTKKSTSHEAWLAEDDDAKDSEKAVVLVRMGAKGGDGKTAKGEYSIDAKEIITFKVGSSTITQKPDSISLKVGDAEIELTSAAINLLAAKIFLAGKSYVGVDAKNSEDDTKILTVAGPAKKAYSPPS